ncbi:endonuclease/exonuclease/phosphatase family protein [Candidatus Eisenbacteria bacterium]|uniref:Endonuclease/exonuclease/phosphatase family protein n=1 Tax=Eiseniibacteriota bacterium TaxID=2212470 RepID=A0ABV6YJ16_UNCEI
MSYRRRYFALALLIVLALAIAITSPTCRVPDDPADRSPLRLITANILYTNDQVADVTDRLTNLDADLILVLEWTGNNLARQQLTAKSYALHADSRRPGTAGSCILLREGVEAKFEVVASPVAGQCTMPVTTGRIKFGPSWVSVIGVHAPPPRSMCANKNAEFLTAVADWFDDGRLRHDIGEAVAADPVVLLGDLNAIPLSKEISAFRHSGLTDACSVTNLRPLFTWRPRTWLPPVARVDYIFLGEQLEAMDAGVFDLPGSDHRLVLADIRRSD